MRFMMIVNADERSEAGILPTAEELRAMGEFNEEMMRSGVMRAGEGLHASSKGARVEFTGGKPKVVDGPFPETKELIAGFWLIEAESLDEAIEWGRRVPFENGRVEIRRVFELEEFDPAGLELHEKHRDQLAGK